MTEKSNKPVPTYDVELPTETLVERLAEKAAEHARQAAYYRRCDRDDPYWWYAETALEEKREREAYAHIIAELRGGVDTREFVVWLSRWMDGSDRSAYGKVYSLIRDEHVGWPRMDEHGNALEADLP